MVFNRELDGAWEEPGVIGTRIEIEGRRITVLWRNSPVLVTACKWEKRDGGIELILAHNGMRYEGAASDYGELRSLFYKDGTLLMTEYFPITGESRQTLKKTLQSRYGNYTVEKEPLKELQGTWRDETGTFTLTFSGDTLTANGTSTRICLLRSNSDPAGSRRYKVADKDPAKYEVLHYSHMEYTGGQLTAQMMVFDAPPHVMRFHKE